MVIQGCKLDNLNADEPLYANSNYNIFNCSTGTSASAPLAAGIIALVLHANPKLNWRDVQHLTVQCAHNANLRATDWSHNAVGRNFSHSFGYGLMDASCMVRKWIFILKLLKEGNWFLRWPELRCFLLFYQL